MEQMELLFAYMQEDMKADRIVNEIKLSPLRQKAEKARDLYFEQQKQSKVIEEQVATMVDRKDAIRDAVTRCEDQLKALSERVAANPPQSAEEAQALIAEAEKYRRTIGGYESEMKSIAHKSQELTSRIQKIGMTMASAKQDFDKFKAEYDKETKEKKQLHALQRVAADQKKVGIDEKLLNEYNEIKKHITPPMARLINGSCSGCNTSQPSAMLRRIEAGADTVECETCGRLLIK